MSWTEAGMMTVFPLSYTLHFHQGSVLEQYYHYIYYFQEQYDGQTLCIRTMITAFMGDASNIMSFSGEVDVEGSVGYTAEWWIFKPQRSGQQVSTK